LSEEVIDTLAYAEIVDLAWKGLLKKLESGDYDYRNEQELRCLLFTECLKHLQEKEFRKPYSIFVDYRINDSLIDLAFPIGENKVLAVEIKGDPSPSNVEEDLVKLREFLDNTRAIRGLFLSIARSDYGLRERLKEQQIFDKFGLKEEGEGKHGLVEWYTFRTPYFSSPLDALFVVLWREILEAPLEKP